MSPSRASCSICGRITNLSPFSSTARVACSNAYAQAISFSSLNLRPVIVTAYLHSKSARSAETGEYHVRDVGSFGNITSGILDYCPFGRVETKWYRDTRKSPKIKG